MRQCFERWKVDLRLTSGFQPCSDDHPDMRYVVYEDMQPTSTKKYFLMGKSTGTMLLRLLDMLSNRTLVAKVLMVHDVGEEGRLLKYAFNMARGRTPNIITVHKVLTNINPLEDLTHQVIVMDDGEPFKSHYLQLMEACQTLAEIFAVQKTIVFQLVYALHFLHYFNIQHRDIRPDNIVFATGEMPAQQFILGDAVFQLQFMHAGCLVMPQLIDFGLAYHHEICQPSDIPVANCYQFKPPDMVFVRSLDSLRYDNSDEIFSLGLTLLRMLRRKPALNGSPQLETNLARVFERLQNGPMSEHYSLHSPREYAEHALILVLLLGYPPDSYTAFYDTTPGKFLVAHKSQVMELPGYDWLARTKSMKLNENTEIYRLLGEILRWERDKRLPSAAALLRTSFFDDLRAEPDSDMQQWCVDR